jgi:hypothetical protein
MTRKSTPFLAAVGALLLVCAIAVAHAAMGAREGEGRLRETAALAARLQLTDLCLFPEANYTRNLSLADFHAPFQDAPMAFEHFPSGSLTLPPGRRR